MCSLNLEHNSLTSFSGLISLNSLKVNSMVAEHWSCWSPQVLCLNHNRVEHLVPPRDATPLSDHVMQSLQVLHLAYNGIRNLGALQLGKIPSLKALFLQGAHAFTVEHINYAKSSYYLLTGNEIGIVEGLNGLRNLSELVLDRNKIKV